MAGKKNEGVVSKLLKKYFITGFSAMVLGMFASLIIGVILGQFAQIRFLSFLAPIAEVAKSSYVTGGAIGAAIAYSFKSKPLVMFSSITVGAFAYQAGGPVGAYIAVVAGAEIGGLIAGRTKFDILLAPLFTIIPGCALSALTGVYISHGMSAIGSFIERMSVLAPIPMGILISVVMGMILTLPISSAAIAMSLGLSGIAGGAAVAGCAANMVGFAVASFRENRFGGLLSQGIGTSMLQMGNIMRRPLIWIPAIAASAVTGPLSSAVFKMTCTPVGAGMGTSALVGQIQTYASMAAEGRSPAYILITIALVHIVLPALIALVVSEGMRRAGWIKPGDMALKTEV